MLLDDFIAAFIGQATGLLNTVLSAAVPKTDEPPRLAEAINLSKCDPPPEGAGITNAFDTTTNALIASKVQLDPLTLMPPADAIVSIIRWIDQRARKSTWDEIWEASSPEHTTWPQDNTGEEQWARHFEQLFLGAPFLGITTVYGLVPTGEGSSAGEGFAAYVYGRIQRISRWLFERPVSAAHQSSTKLQNWGSCYIEHWNDLGPTPEIPISNGPYPHGVIGPLDANGYLVPDPFGPRWVAYPNEDPAVSIAVGCQHLCTYGALTRGFRIEHVGYHGYMAGQSNEHLPLFRSPSVNPWDDAYGQYDVPILTQQEKELGTWGRWTKVSMVEAPVVGQPTLVTLGSAYTLGTPDDPATPIDDSRMGTIGHCACISRLKPGASAADARLQEIDSHCETQEKTPCVFDGDTHPRSTMAAALGPKHGYTDVLGLGTVPPIDPGPMIEHLAKARPVGLMRLVISRRVPGTLPASLGSPLYISPMSRMYGDADKQNYTFSRMLWAIRNSPGFSDLKPSIVFFAPVGKLARSMWAYGSRTVTLGDFDAAVEKITATSFTAVLAISNRAQPAGAAGTSWCSLNDASDVVTLATRATAVPWNQSYVDPLLAAHREAFESAAELFRVDVARSSIETDTATAKAAVATALERLAAGLTPPSSPGAPVPEVPVDDIIDTLQDIYHEVLHG